MTTVTPMVPPVAVPGPGAPDVVPPPSLPLSFLGAAGVGLVGAGVGVALASDKFVNSPMNDGALSAVHVTMLAFLSTAVLGALHQFGPVVARRKLRSVGVGWATLIGWVATAWLIPTGFAHGYENLVATGAVVGAVSVVLAVYNLSGPLLSSDHSLPLWGLRASVTLFVVTVTFGVVYAFDRQAGWFPLLPNRVMAHAHLGLLGWLGLTYVAVAEKLWPMFLLAHRPSSKEGVAAVGLMSSGAVVLTPGLLFGVPALSWAGGILVVAGLVAHVLSLRACVIHRRRKLELLHAFLFISVGFLVVAVALAAVIGFANLSTLTRVRLISAEVAAIAAWLGLAVIGHTHKIVPFIGYSALRGRGINKAPSGKPLLFGDLFNLKAAKATLVLTTAGFAGVVGGLIVGEIWPVRLGAAAISIAGLTVTLNLAITPRGVIAAHKEATA